MASDDSSFVVNLGTVYPKCGSSVTDIIKVWERPRLCCCLMKRSYSRNKGYQEMRCASQILRTDWHPAMIRRRCNKRGNRKDYFFTKLRGVPNSAKQTILESVGLFWGQKHSENGLNFFHAFLIYQSLHFAKWPIQPSKVVRRKHCRLWCHRYRQDHQYREPQIRAKIGKMNTT